MYEKTLYIYTYFVCLSFRLENLQRIASDTFGEIEPDGWARACEQVKRGLFVIYVLCLLCFLVFSLQPCGLLLGKG